MVFFGVHVGCCGIALSPAQRLQSLREQLHKLHVRLHFGGLVEGEGDNGDSQGEGHPLTASLQDAVQQARIVWTCICTNKCIPSTHAPSFQETTVYEQHCSRLRTYKQQVKTLQTVLEQNRAQLQRDFYTWRTALLRQVTQDSPVPTNPPFTKPRSHPLRSTSDSSQEAQQQQEALGAADAAIPSTQQEMHVPRGASLAGSASPLQSYSSALSNLSSALEPAPAPAQEQHQGLLEGLPAALQQQVEALLTGDADIDRDIVRFYRARHAMLSQE